MTASDGTMVGHPADGPNGLLAERQEKAMALLDAFSKFTSFKHGLDNRYVQWLNSLQQLDVAAVHRFLCAWYPVSRHQPQILYLCMAAYPDWADRMSLFENVGEEDGVMRPGLDPHYLLLEQLVQKVAGPLVQDREAQAVTSRFHNSLGLMSPAEATGLLAGIEHCAITISWYLRKMIELCGRADLLDTDLYLTIHVKVEPEHIIWAHGKALQFLERGEHEQVLAAFRRVMAFWDEYWPVAFSRLNYPRIADAA